MNNPATRKNKSYMWLAMPATLLMGIPIIAALLLLANLLRSHGIAEWAAFFSTNSVIVGAGYSLLLALIPTLLAVYSAFWLLARMQKPPAWLSALLAIPHVAFAIGLSLLLLPGGWFSRAFAGFDISLQIPLLTPILTFLFTEKSLAFLIITLWLKELPFVLLMALIVLQQLPVREWQQVGASLGYRQQQTFWRVISPQLLLRLRLPIMVVAIYGLAVVDVAMVAGPNLPSPLAVQVLQWYQQAGNQVFAELGSILLVLLSAASLSLLLVHEWLHKQWAQYQIGAGATVGARVRAISSSKVLTNSKLLASLQALPFSLFLILKLATIAALLLWSFAAIWPNNALLPTSFSLENWRWEWLPLQAVLWSSLWLGIVAASAATIAVLMLLEWEFRRGKAINDAVMLLPLLIPQLPLLLAWHTHVAPFTLSAPSFWLIWAHSIFAAAYIWLTLAASYRRFPTIWLTQAASFGYSRWQCWLKVRLRMLLAPILLAWAVGFSVSILQYLPTIIFGAGRILTVTTEATAYGSGFERSLAAIYGLAQIAWPLLMFIVVAMLANRFRVHTVRGN